MPLIEALEHGSPQLRSKTVRSVRNTAVVRPEQRNKFPTPPDCNSSGPPACLHLLCTKDQHPSLKTVARECVPGWDGNAMVNGCGRAIGPTVFAAHSVYS